MSKKKPLVAIVGRRNVGKSTLFNALINKKMAIVDDHPGLTRDVISYRVDTETHSFLISDTPGLDLPDNEELSEPILTTAYEALGKADLIVLMFEDPIVQKFDHDLLRIVRKLDKPTVMVVNKMDSEKQLVNMSNFYELGVSDLLPVSALRRSNLDLLLDKITAFIPANRGEEQIADMRISFVGKPNAGKSTLLNSLLGYGRSVVSDVPGTTRDSINELINFENKKIEIVDTAGLRKRSKVKESVEFYSLTRTIRAIEHSDVVIHLIDAQSGMTDTDKKISDEIVKANKPVIIAVNKWDTVSKDTNTFKEYTAELKRRFFRIADFPVISISAKEKVRIHKLLSSAVELFEDSHKRIDTGVLNRRLEQMKNSGRLPGYGSDIKVFFATQMNQTPPTFKFFVNDASKFRLDVVRYFQKELQKLLGIKGLPIKIKIEGKPRNIKNVQEAIDIREKNRRKKGESRTVRIKKGEKRSKKRK
ncbi:MAG TPA: ribosome biogenesis GTPase Der [Spirochaetota bacterium]|nr:ribosome biogenesis GTPase Der [Spirochaetota bacterium]